MAKSTDPKAQLVYPAAKSFVDRCLASNDSLFTPGRAIWTAETLDDFHRRFVGQPDTSATNFETKLERQLTGASAATIQLAAETLFVYFLVAQRVKATTRIGQIERLLGWGADIRRLPPSLEPAMQDGGFVSSGGTAFSTYKPFQLQYVLEVARRLKNRQDRADVVADPWKFRELAHEIKIRGSRPMREAMLHLVHPDVFEGITSTDAKRRIVQAYSDRVRSPDADIDRKLLEIRRSFEEESGEPVDFYQPPFQDVWQPESSRWGQFIYWARRFHERSDFEIEERDYKLDIAERMKNARQAVEDGKPDWLDSLRSALARDNNLTDYRTHGPFLEWLRHDRGHAAVLTAIWNPDASPEERIRGFSQQLPREVISGIGGRLNLASVLHLVHEPERWPPYRWTPFERAFRLTEFPVTAGSEKLDEATLYRHVLDFLDRLDEEAGKRGLNLTDRLDAQATIWAVTQWEPDDWPKKDVAALKRWREGVMDPAPPEERDSLYGATPVAPPAERGDLVSLADRLYLTEQFLKEICTLLEAKGQVIFQGPPGTGKTFVARELAQHLAAGDPHAVELVQFHPPYAYEDFVEGFRPVREGTGFHLRPGPLRRIARAAQNDPGRNYFLIIDEINRGNLPKVFGELYFLLEYRDAQITLQYSEERFSLPRNLNVIGTMNTADRSIALIDAALRRRFYFVGFYPDEEPIGSLLARWLRKNNPHLAWVAEVLARANERLADRELAIGPSHFLSRDLDEEGIERIWRHSILPYVAAHFFDDPDRSQEFDLERLRGASGRHRAEDRAPQGADQAGFEAEPGTSDAGD